MIKVIDNFFEEGIQKKIWKKMMRPKWSYTGGGTTRCSSRGYRVP